MLRNRPLDGGSASGEIGTAASCQSQNHTLAEACHSRTAGDLADQLNWALTLIEIAGSLRRSKVVPRSDTLDEASSAGTFPTRNLSSANHLGMAAHRNHAIQYDADVAITP